MITTEYKKAKLNRIQLTNAGNKLRATNVEEANTKKKKSKGAKRENRNQEYNHKNYQIIPEGHNKGDKIYSEMGLKLIQTQMGSPISNKQLLEKIANELLINDGWSSFKLSNLWGNGFSSWFKELENLGVGKCICIAKAYSPNRLVDVDAIHELLYLVSKEKATKGIIYTTSRFTKSALAILYDNTALLHFLDVHQLEAKLYIK